MSHALMVSGPARAALLLAIGALCGCAGAWMVPAGTTNVQEINGQRVDVPQQDLAGDGSGLLRNGLSPQPQEFN
jgi:hypothetical protein